MMHENTSVQNSKGSQMHTVGGECEQRTTYSQNAEKKGSTMENLDAERASTLSTKDARMNEHACSNCRAPLDWIALKRT